MPPLHIHDHTKPVPWEEFESVARPYSVMTVRMIGWVCWLAVVGGVLFAVNP